MQWLIRNDIKHGCKGALSNCTLKTLYAKALNISDIPTYSVKRFTV